MPSSSGSKIVLSRVFSAIDDKEPGSEPSLVSEVCGIDGASFLAINRRISYYSTNSGGHIVDIGGFCFECRGYICHRHVLFAPFRSLGNADAEYQKYIDDNENVLQLQCAEHRVPLLALTAKARDEHHAREKIVRALMDLSISAPRRRSWWRRTFGGG